LRFALGGARLRSIFLQFQRILGHSWNWDFAWDNRSDRTDLAVVVADLNSSWKERDRHTHTRAHSVSFLGVFQQWDLGCPESWENAIIIMVVPPRKRKQVQTMITTSCAIGQLWIHSFLRVYTGKICCKLSQLGFWGVCKGRKTPLPTHHCWYRNFCYFLLFFSNLHSFSLWALSSGF
jgi:hypothetical protein